MNVSFYFNWLIFSQAGKMFFLVSFIFPQGFQQSLVSLNLHCPIYSTYLTYLTKVMNDNINRCLGNAIKSTLIPIITR